MLAVPRRGLVWRVPHCDVHFRLFFQYLKWYYIFGALWVMNFVFACQEVVIAGAVATWYFTRSVNMTLLSAVSNLKESK
jgi:uncharacterized membrane protein